MSSDSTKLIIKHFIKFPENVDYFVKKLNENNVFQKNILQKITNDEIFFSWFTYTEESLKFKNMDYHYVWEESELSTYSRYFLTIKESFEINRNFIIFDLVPHLFSFFVTYLTSQKMALLLTKEIANIIKIDSTFIVVPEGNSLIPSSCITDLNIEPDTPYLGIEDVKNFYLSEGGREYKLGTIPRDDIDFLYKNPFIIGNVNDNPDELEPIEI
jgi:hypothetical protein